MAEGYSASQTLSQLHDRLVTMETLSDKQKSVIAEKMGVSGILYNSTGLQCLFGQIVDRRLMDGADEYLQLMDLTSVIMEQFCHAHS